jgi:hypothetical protein
MPNTLRTRSAHPWFGWTALFRLLGALLCLASVALMLASELLVLPYLPELEHAQCAPPPGLPTPQDMIIVGAQLDIFVAPAALALLLMGVRVLLGKSPGISPPVATVLLVGGALMIYFLSLPLGIAMESALGSVPPCYVRAAGSSNGPLFPAGVLAGLLGGIMLSRTTRYRPLRLEDA